MFKKLVPLVLIISLQFAYGEIAPNWSITAMSYKTDIDSLFASDPDGNSRAVIGGMDMDNDGKQEVIASDYNGHRVIVYEYDADNNAFDVVWASPTVDSTNYAYGPKAIGVGDLDADGKQEIVFPSSAYNAEGHHIYEWDGVTGSDNYGTTYSAICALEVDTCCAGDGPGTDSYGVSYRGDHEEVRIFDIDGDDEQELILPIYDGGPKGTMIVSLNDGLDIVHNSGSDGIGTWTTEFFVDISDYSGSSPYHATPADLNGDGNYEILNHAWGFHFYNIAANGADSYTAPDPDTGWYSAPPGDVSIFGGNAFDIDSDGNDEVFYSVYYGAWGVGAGNIWAVDYSSGDNVLNIDSSNVGLVAEGIGRYIGEVGYGYDGSWNKSLFVGNTAPNNITALEYTGSDPLSPDGYAESVIYSGELEIVHTTITTDSLGVVDTTYSDAPWGYPSRIQTNWDGELLDFDGDGKKELLVSFESMEDSLDTIIQTWNATDSLYDETVTSVVNPKAWTYIIIENGSLPVSVVDPITFISPEDYRLEQNYPNPFNPTTSINYTLPINRKVSLKVYNVTGQLVRTLVNNELISAGSHEAVWNGMSDSGKQVASGVYFYSLEWAGMSMTKRLTLLK
ncbi:MAG: FG-GAP-like repeat-containing protein [Bacteroidota bacterium]|nr:FG-GAP-like repeat-containing protein [Bacteroidota bacterium]